MTMHWAMATTSQPSSSIVATLTTIGRMARSGALRHLAAAQGSARATSTRVGAPGGVIAGDSNSRLTHAVTSGRTFSLSSRSPRAVTRPSAPYPSMKVITTSGGSGDFAAEGSQQSWTSCGRFASNARLTSSAARGRGPPTATKPVSVGGAAADREPGGDALRASSPLVEDASLRRLGGSEVGIPRLFKPR